MVVCLLCLELKQPSSRVIEITSAQWQEENIEKLIEKHFWSLKSIASHHSHICCDCWIILNEFHKLYIRVEKAHALKTELLVDNVDVGAFAFDSQTTTAINDTVQKTLFVTELTVNLDDEDKPLIIKREFGNEEQHMTAVIGNAPKTRQRRCRDPLEKVLPVKSRIIKKLQRHSNEELEEQIQIKSTLDLEDNPINETIAGENGLSSTEFVEDYKNCSSDFDDDGINNSENEETSTADFKPHTNSYYKRKTKRNKLDEFLAQNFKITCAICKAAMPTFQELCKHFTTEHNKRGFVSCCNKKFLRRSVLADHIHRHLDPEYFKCKDCGKIMSDRRCLELHVKIHETQDKTQVCDICGKAFSRLSALKNHKLIHLSDEEKKFPCKECGKLFGNNCLLSNHVRIVHLDKYALVCDICGAKMRSKEVFERHILKHQGVPVPTISCDICGLKMTDHRGLKRHKDTQHPEGGKQEFHCHICSKISPTLKAHKRHVQYKHELGYDFKCTICDKAFKRSCSLTEHMATHTGTVLYTCPYCPKTFNSNANMHSHRKKGHPKEWEEACRAKYSGNLPPNYKRPAAIATDVERNNNNGITNVLQ